MRSKTVALLLTDLGVIKTHSRPHVSDDNPYSEANFKTLKYRPGFPKRFGSIEDARAHVDAFVSWYNEQHHHCGINYLTPHDLHYGHGPDRLQERQAVLDAAYERHPERFVKGRPSAGEIPAAAWINKPPKTEEAASE
jgi:putative transposase